MRNKTVELKCSWCGNIFAASTYDVKERGRKYCGIACQGLAKRKKRPLRADLVADYAAGLSTPDLARKYDVAKGTIYNWFKLYEIPTRSIPEGISVARTGKPLSEKHKKAISAGHCEGKETSRICIECGETFTLPRPSSPKKLCSKGCFALDAARRSQVRNQGAARPRYARSVQGMRADIGISVRSRWEHDYILIANEWIRQGLLLKWEYEPMRFEFPIKRGTRWYLPDFKMYWSDGRIEWHEVKGYMDNKSKVKIRRFRKYYPDETLVVIDSPAFMALKKIYKPLLPGWES